MIDEQKAAIVRLHDLITEDELHDQIHRIAYDLAGGWDDGEDDHTTIDEWRQQVEWEKGREAREAALKKERIYVSHDTTPTIVRPSGNWTIFTKAIPITNPDGEVIAYTRDADIAFALVTLMNDALTDRPEPEPRPKYQWELALEDDGPGHRVFVDALTSKLALAVKEHDSFTPEETERGVTWVRFGRGIRLSRGAFWVWIDQENDEPIGVEQISQTLAILLAAKFKMPIQMDPSGTILPGAWFTVQDKK